MTLFSMTVILPDICSVDDYDRIKRQLKALGVNLKGFYGNSEGRICIKTECDGSVTIESLDAIEGITIDPDSIQEVDYGGPA